MSCCSSSSFQRCLQTPNQQLGNDKQIKVPWPSFCVICAHVIAEVQPSRAAFDERLRNGTGSTEEAVVSIIHVDP